MPSTQPPSDDRLYVKVHRKLIGRIGIAALGVAAIFGALAWNGGSGRIAATVAEVARIELRRFNVDALPLIDSGLRSSPEAQAALDEFLAGAGDGQVLPRDGRFVALRIYDGERREVARMSRNEYPAIDAVNASLDRSSRYFPAPGAHKVLQITLDGQPYVGVGIPLLDSSGRVAALAEATFAVSAEAMSRVRAETRRILAYVLGIVLLTAITLYPLILGLLGQLTRLSGRLLDANLETMQALGSAIAKRDSDTDAHNFRVTIYSVHLARAAGLGEGEIRRVIKGALLHDIGKLGIRDEVLLKPASLDEQEFEIMKTHVEHGLDIIRRASWLGDAADVVGGHHEKFDGAGYPAGLSGEDIPINARVFAIADVFDALTSRRPYKEPFSFDEAMAMMQAASGTHFDPRLLELFSNIAHDLYDRYSRAEADAARDDLEQLMQDYFQGAEALLGAA